MSSSGSEINTTYSDLALMIGGQILIIVILVMIGIFGVNPIARPLRTMKENLSSTLLNSPQKGK
jgi:hypothetical protein